MITVTDTAAFKIKESLTKRGKGLGIKVGVKTTGCSGLAYTLEYVDMEQGKEHCIEHHDVNGVRIYMDPKHRPYLYGMTMDWMKKDSMRVLNLLIPMKEIDVGAEKALEFDIPRDIH